MNPPKKGGKMGGGYPPSSPSLDRSLSNVLEQHSNKVALVPVTWSTVEDEKSMADGTVKGMYGKIL